MRRKINLPTFHSIVILMVLCASAIPDRGFAEPTLRFKDSFSSALLPLAHPDWPQPNDQAMVFYLQRTMNRNTIVYAARYDPDGYLQTRKPIEVYWRRFEEQNQKRGLKLLERLFAFGVKTRRSRADNGWSVSFVALPDVLTAELRQSAPFQSALWARINDRDYRLVYGYLDLDDSGFITRVVQLRLYTFDPVSDSYVTHLIKVSGGDIHE